MDLDIDAAARALAAGDPLRALNGIALRDDAPALALRGIAMAQLGDLDRARALVRAAARGFGAAQPVARARCVVAEAEIALASRELRWPGNALDTARATLHAHGDLINAAYAAHLAIRHLLLTGRLDEAEQRLADFDARPLLPAARAAHELALAGIAMRRRQARAAHEALARATQAAARAGIPAVHAEVEQARQALAAPAARLVSHGATRVLLLDQVEMLLQSPALVVDACRHVVSQAKATISLARRPVLFSLAQALAVAWPRDVPRRTLVQHTFRTRAFDESHRARLRVEIGRLRTALRPLADIRATSAGFVLAPHQASEVAVLERPVDEPHAAVRACLADGEAWSSSALALALGTSQRTVQRALDALASAGHARSFGRGRARRWTAPLPRIATPLLLAVPPASD